MRFEFGKWQLNVGEFLNGRREVSTESVSIQIKKLWWWRLADRPYFILCLSLARLGIISEFAADHMYYDAVAAGMRVRMNGGQWEKHDMWFPTS